MSFEEDRLPYEALSEQNKPWEPDWGKIVIILAIVQLVLSVALNR